MKKNNNGIRFTEFLSAKIIEASFVAMLFNIS